MTPELSERIGRALGTAVPGSYVAVADRERVVEAAQGARSWTDLPVDVRELLEDLEARIDAWRRGDLTAGDWNPVDHPRDHRGRFAEVGEALRFDAEDVITNWRGLASKVYEPDQIIAVRSDDKVRLRMRTQTLVDVEVRSADDARWQHVSTRTLGEVGAGWVAEDTGSGTWIVPPRTATPPTPTPPPPPPTPGPTREPTDAERRAFRVTLRGQPGNVGYWSKPEKIWDAVKVVQSEHPDSDRPGHSRFTPDQILRALDEQLRTKEPNPFRTKMKRWLASPAGRRYVERDGGPTPPPPPLPTPPVRPPTPSPTRTPVKPTSAVYRKSIADGDVVAETEHGWRIRWDAGSSRFQLQARLTDDDPWVTRSELTKGQTYELLKTDTDRRWLTPLVDASPSPDVPDEGDDTPRLVRLTGSTRSLIAEAVRQLPTEVGDWRKLLANNFSERFKDRNDVTQPSDELVRLKDAVVAAGDALRRDVNAASLDDVELNRLRAELANVGRPDPAVSFTENEIIRAERRRIYFEMKRRHKELLLDALSQIRPYGNVYIRGEGMRKRSDVREPFYVTDNAMLVEGDWQSVMDVVSQHMPDDWVNVSNRGRLGVFSARRAFFNGGYWDWSMTRPGYDTPSGIIALPRRSGRSSAGYDGAFKTEREEVSVHEMGHRMEQVIPGLKALEFAYVRGRTTRNGVVERRQSLKTLRGGGYDASELTYPDDFDDPYVGKSYETSGPKPDRQPWDRAWEVFQMGLQDTFGRRTNRYGDDDLESFTLGVLATLGRTK